MNSGKTIQVLSSHQIDKEKWDACINNSSNTVIYAYSYYLDTLCENWSGIVVNDYETVMPVPWKKKFGIVYTYAVPFVQQLGFFSGQNVLNGDLLLDKFFQVYKYGDYSFNFQNRFQFSLQKTCTNFIIDLSLSYHDIAANYNAYLRSYLKKSSIKELNYGPGTDIDNAVNLNKQYYGDRVTHVKDKDFDNFISLCKILRAKNQVLIRRVTDQENSLLALILMLKDEKRLYNIVNVITEEGRKNEANHYLYDQLLKEFSGSGLIFDFEGSDLPGVKFFYEKFGAINQPYCKISFNHLPLPFRFFKRSKV